MKTRLPLYAQVLLWFFVNLAVVAIALALLLRAQLNLGLDSLLSGRAGERIGALGRAVAGELRSAPRERWDAILDRFGEAYGVTLILRGPAGEQIAGAAEPLPPGVAGLLRRPMPQTPPGPGRRPGPEGPPPDRGPGPPGDRPPNPRTPEGFAPPPRPDPNAQPPPPRDFPGPNARPLFFTRDGNPPKYWAGVQIPLGNAMPRHPWNAMLLVVSPNLAAGGLFLDARPWILGGAGVILLSAIIWAPFVRRVTRRLNEMTTATEQIAEGRFEARVRGGEGDELARLGGAINRMAGRLGHLVHGQRRFLGDIAHELCSPLARARVALGLLARKTPPEAGGQVRDVDEELDQLSGLVHELLSFSKAALGPRKAPVSVMPLRPLVDEVVHREARDCETRIGVPGDMALPANREMLERALANVIRNAARYAGGRGPITIQAEPRDGGVELRVLDEGPGIPEDTIERIFEPFFRPEEARTRETGGAGLGLAIARTCLEAFGASIRCANRPAGGLEVVIRLAAAAGSGDPQAGGQEDHPAVSHS